MGEWIGRGRKARRAYGFDEIAIVPGGITIDPDDTDPSWVLDGTRIPLPIMAAAMDGVVSPRFASQFWKFGGLGILNLEGVWSRYDDPEPTLTEISKATPEKATELVQKLYVPPLREDLVARRIQEIKATGAPAIVSSTPQRAARYGAIAKEAGVDYFVVQSTVSTVRHESTHFAPLDLGAFVKAMAPVPVLIGNCVTYEATLELMETGCAAVIIGIGPGAACTTRGVLGVGVPQVTATADAAAARNFHYTRTGRYVPIVTDGGMSHGGDICKAFACGADAVIIGSAFARSIEAPGHGFHWGMATPHSNLPRGTRVHVGTTGTLEEIIVGPARVDDGSQNLLGALRTCMGYLGARQLRDMHLAELVIAPAIKSEGKIFQRAQNIGMGK
ncbi:MAG: GuaB3 family IMP dehydrogenase-related protein [Candidatus Sumerlaeia bacterium]|nr:GuaB3 family IMP dehydrogenase-related protein [Candidatus Sumerlaeia bacterium]